MHRSNAARTAVSPVSASARSRQAPTWRSARWAKRKVIPLPPVPHGRLRPYSPSCSTDKCGLQYLQGVVRAYAIVVTPTRRAEKEVTDPDWCRAVLDEAPYLVLALNDGGAPYA